MQNEINYTNLTFMQLWEDYNEYIKLKLKSQSYRKETNNYIVHIIPYFKGYLVKNITAQVYIKWMNNIEDKGYKYSYKKSLHTSMVMILNYAVKFYDLPRNIAHIVGGFNKKKSEVKNINFWTLEEFNTFIKVVDDPIYRLLFNTLYFTGLRIGEALALTWNDFINNYLDVNKTISKTLDKNGNYIINSPKTESSIRKVKIDNNLINALNKLHLQEKCKVLYNDNWFIFGGIKPLSQTTVGRKHKNYCTLANIKKIRLHDFRHSHATLLLSRGVPITAISQRLGHSDIALTLNTYSHLIVQDEDKAVDIINLINTTTFSLNHKC